MNVKRSLLAITAASALILPGVAGAQLVQIGGVLDASGGGLGAQATVLTLQTPGNSSNGSGCVTPTAFTCTVSGTTFLDANVQQGQSQTRLASAFPGLTANNFRIVFNAAEPGAGSDNGITLNNLVVTLYGSGGSTFSTANFGSAVNLTPASGVGNYGFVFGLQDATQISLFNAFLAANPNASIGVAASISNAQGGLETFAIAQATGPTSVVPEPSTYALMASGLVGMGVIARRRRRA